MEISNLELFRKIMTAVGYERAKGTEHETWRYTENGDISSFIYNEKTNELTRMEYHQTVLLRIPVTIGLDAYVDCFLPSEPLYVRKKSRRKFKSGNYINKVWFWTLNPNENMCAAYYMKDDETIVSERCLVEVTEEEYNAQFD